MQEKTFKTKEQSQQQTDLVDQYSGLFFTKDMHQQDRDIIIQALSKALKKNPSKKHLKSLVENINTYKYSFIEPGMPGKVRAEILGALLSLSVEQIQILQPNIHLVIRKISKSNVIYYRAIGFFGLGRPKLIKSFASLTPAQIDFLFKQSRHLLLPSLPEGSLSELIIALTKLPGADTFNSRLLKFLEFAQENIGYFHSDASSVRKENLDIERVAILTKLAHYPLEKINSALISIGRHTPTGMPYWDRLDILQALIKVKGEGSLDKRLRDFQEIFEAKQGTLFYKEIDLSHRSIALKTLTQISGEHSFKENLLAFLEALQKHQKLFLYKKGKLGVWYIPFMVKALSTYSPQQIDVIAQNAPILFSAIMGGEDKIRILNALALLPGDSPLEEKIQSFATSLKQYSEAFLLDLKLTGGTRSSLIQNLAERPGQGPIEKRLAELSQALKPFHKKMFFPKEKASYDDMEPFFLLIKPSIESLNALAQTLPLLLKTEHFNSSKKLLLAFIHGIILKEEQDHSKKRKKTEVSSASLKDLVSLVDGDLTYFLNKAPQESKQDIARSLGYCRPEQRRILVTNRQKLMAEIRTKKPGAPFYPTSQSISQLCSLSSDKMKRVIEKKHPLFTSNMSLADRTYSMGILDFIDKPVLDFLIKTLPTLGPKKWLIENTKLILRASENITFEQVKSYLKALSILRLSKKEGKKFYNDLPYLTPEQIDALEELWPHLKHFNDYTALGFFTPEQFSAIGHNLPTLIKKNIKLRELLNLTPEEIASQK